MIEGQGQGPEGVLHRPPGQSRGRTPLALGGLRPGSYTVTLTLRRHDPLTYTVQVAAGAAQVVQARFSR